MKTIFSSLMLFVCIAAQPAFANTPPLSTQIQQKQIPHNHDPKTEPMPKAFTDWEQENVGREVAEENKYSELWNKTLLLLVCVLVVLFAGTWYLKKIGGLKVKEGAKDSRIQLLEKRVISPKAVIYLMQIDGQKIALSETSTGITVLQGFKPHLQELENSLKVQPVTATEIT